MKYDPYQDLVNVLADTKTAVSAPTAKTVADLLKQNNSFYQSTYRDVRSEVQGTKDYLTEGQAYRDEGAQAIRAAYANYAKTAGEHMAAEHAADNAGNLDSYAAAQANRAAAAMLNEGEEAVRARAEQLEEGLLASDANTIDAAKSVIDAVGESAGVQADLATEAQSARTDALKALLELYGLNTELSAEAQARQEEHAERLQTALQSARLEEERSAREHARKLEEIRAQKEA